MGNPFRAETWTATVTDPDDGEEWEVILRTPLAIDNARISDCVRVVGGRREALLGAMRLQQVVDAIVDWTLPMPLSRDAIENMREEVFLQIRDEVEAGPPTKRQALNAQAELDTAIAAAQHLPSPANLEKLVMASTMAYAESTTEKTEPEPEQAEDETLEKTGELAATSS